MRGWAVAAFGALLACSGPVARSAAPSPSAPSQVTQPGLSGTLLGHDGKPMAMAHVHVAGVTYPVDGTGRFHVPIAGDVVQVMFTGVDHAEKVLAVAGGDAVSVQVKLGTYARDTDAPVVASYYAMPLNPKVLVVLGSVELKGDGDEVSAVISASEPIAYSVSGIAVNRSVNGVSNVHVYDNGGDYASVATPSGGKATLRANRSALPAQPAKPYVAFANPRGRSAQIAALIEDASSRRSQFEASLSGDHPMTIGPDAVRTQRLLDTADGADRLVRWVTLVALIADPIAVMEPEQAATVAAQIKAEVPVGSGVWRLFDDALSMMLMASADDTTTQYVISVLSSMKNAEAAAGLALRAWMRLRSLRAGPADVLKDWLLATHPDSWFATQVRVQMGAIAPGKSMVAFDLADHETGRRINGDSLRGKLYLLEFWATWCEPCVAEMPRLHEVHAKYKDRLTIVSVNIDDSLALFTKFRADKWPMPWRHVVLDSEQSAAAKQLFEIVGIPRPILVSKNGTVIATDGELRVNLESVLEAAVK